MTTKKYLIYAGATVSAAAIAAGVATSIYFTMQWDWIDTILNPVSYFNYIAVPNYRLSSIFNLFDTHITVSEVLKNSHNIMLRTGISFIVLGSVAFIGSSIVAIGTIKKDIKPAQDLKAVIPYAVFGGAAIIAVGAMLVANAPNHMNLFNPEIFVENVLKPQFAMYNLSPTLSTDEALNYFGDFSKNASIISWLATGGAIAITAAVIGLIAYNHHSHSH